MRDIGMLIISLGIILIGAEAFTNGIEWLGKRLRLGAGAVGSIFAAVGTALPETMVPIMAILGGVGPEGAEIGIGAILGAPFMLATVAFFITGVSALVFRRRNLPLRLDPKVVNHDLQFFLIVYFLAIVASFLPTQNLKNATAVCLVAAYGVYVYQTIRDCKDDCQHEELAPLYMERNSSFPSTGMILVQITLALVAIVFGADRFVNAVQPIAVAIGVPVFVLSLIITPIATELPEKFNSVLWVRKGKDTLAMGNLTGAMVFQSSVIPAIGIALTPWKLDPLALWSALLALGAAVIPFISLRRRGEILPTTLLIGGAFYLSFIWTVVRFSIH
ncbi:sodium:calcium antiporter [Desulfosporosinus meridiei]|uniref:Ca2+/Na+ antiporter n=1 Tax=Desulfosporosinus meridiei (strain ATCC BAA-275 / DSM 13257 / KCTC 12902 / NCIMB 13706 / S10) TaxID=768704 RepID=J7J509_DESMD|nr:sodium:calcium antiporter [Desulfosporosinus meridiei]AFQ46041.1 Ca2+/Na+ antiporter [Desulfosporosinus meridiei DSM 13257]